LSDTAESVGQDREFNGEGIPLGPLGKYPLYSETSLDDDDAIIADCPECHDPMLLGEMWKELIDEGHQIPECPDCEPEEWSDDADPKISGVEVAALAE
jgi:hypothetical protein